MRRIWFVLLIALIVSSALVFLAATSGRAIHSATEAAAKSVGDNEAVDCGCEESPVPGVLAIVNGIEITERDISDRTGQEVREMQNQVIQARRGELDRQINTQLLEAEAERQGISTGVLVEREILSRFPVPTEADAGVFYDRNRDQIQGEFKDVRDDIIQYLRAQQQRVAAMGLAERLRSAAEVKVFVESVTPPVTSEDRLRVLAEVNGSPVTSADIEDQLRPLILNVQEQIYESYRRELESKIDDLLLRQEAEKRNTSIESLVASEARARTSKVSESEARAFYLQNKNQINGEYEQIKNDLIGYLQAKSNEGSRATFLERLRKDATIRVFLKPPYQSGYTIATDDQPSDGNPSAPITIIEFTDYQCPACARTQGVLEAVIREYGERVRLVIRDYPLKRHADAFKAAEAAEAAREQGQYWPYIALLFGNQSRLQTQDLKAYAARLGLDRQRFDAALDSGRFAAEVERDLRDGKQLGVDGTPTLFVNGRRLRELSYESLKAAIDAALQPPPGT